MPAQLLAVAFRHLRGLCQLPLLVYHSHFREFLSSWVSQPVYRLSYYSHMITFPLRDWPCFIRLCPKKYKGVVKYNLIDQTKPLPLMSTIPFHRQAISPLITEANLQSDEVVLFFQIHSAQQ